MNKNIHISVKEYLEHELWFRPIPIDDHKTQAEVQPKKDDKPNEVLILIKNLGEKKKEGDK